MLPVINLGPLSLPAPQLVLILGLWLGTVLAERHVTRKGSDSDVLFKVIWISLASGILGGRLSFIARNPIAFQGEWTSVFSLNPALIDPVGGFLIALVAGYIVSSRNQQANGDFLNDLVPFFAVLTSTTFLANFASGAGYGTLTDAPWGIELWGGPRQPVQLYYLFASLVVLYLVVFRNNAQEQIPWATFLSFVIYTTGYLIVLSSFQDSAGNLIGGFRVTQLASWFIFTLCIFIFNRINNKEVKNATV